MFQKNIFEECGKYDEYFFYTQDYDLWTRLALNSKIIVGVRSTSLYQLGSLGMIIYPIDLDQKIFNMSGNLTEINLNPYPTNAEFDKNINHLIIKENRCQYLTRNFNTLIGLDNTLQLNELPSNNIKNILLEHL